MQSVLWLLKCPSTVSINNFCALANSIKTCLSNYPQKTGSVIPNKTMSQQSVKPNDLEIIWNRNPVDSYHFHEIEPYSRQATATDRTRTWVPEERNPFGPRSMTQEMNFLPISFVDDETATTTSCYHCLASPLPFTFPQALGSWHPNSASNINTEDTNNNGSEPRADF